MHLTEMNKTDTKHTCAQVHVRTRARVRTHTHTHTHTKAKVRKKNAVVYLLALWNTGLKVMGSNPISKAGFFQPCLTPAKSLECCRVTT